MTGEKVSEYQITQSMVAVLRERDLMLNTYSLAPCWDEELPYYGLFVERGDLVDLASGERLVQRLDETLRQLNIEYDAKRESRRLGPIRLELVRPGFWTEWDWQRLQRSGGGHDQYKHPCLINDLKFAEQARGAHLAPPV